MRSRFIRRYIAVQAIIMFIIFLMIVFTLLRSRQSGGTCHINIYNEKGNLIWGNPPWLYKDSYIIKIPVMDNYWTMKLSKTDHSIHINQTVKGFTALSMLTLMAALSYVQRRFIKKTEKDFLILNFANDGFWEWNIKTGKIITSPKWIDMTGYAPEKHGFRGIMQKEAIHQEDYPAVMAVFQACLKGESREFRSEYRIKNKAGSYIWVLNKGKVYCNGKGQPDKVVGILSNIDDCKKNELKMEYMEYYDVLTGLPNKAQFMNTLERVLKTMEEPFCSYCILMIDLDNFKIQNNLLGLDFCDQLLKLAASRLLQTAGPENMVARFGGDEFLILIRDHKGTEDVVNICQNFIKSFGSPFMLMERSVHLSISIGLVCGSSAGQTVNHVLRNADTALNKAKESGRNRYCIYNAQMHEEIIRKSNIEASIRTALSNNSLLIYYQLQQDLSRGDIRGIEALARLNSEELGMIQPIEFIETAEQTGLILPLGSLILKNACKQGKAWIDKGYQFGKLSINISVHQLRNENFYDQVREVLNETQFPVNQLELEITENVLLEFSQNNIGALKKLQSLGVSIALDDFGTGYSSLNYLTVLPIDILKIDKSFLGRVLESKTEHQVIKSITELAHGLNLKVVCEGVETVEQRQILKAIGCDYIQGYYFAKPGDVESIERCFQEGIRRKNEGFD